MISFQVIFCDIDYFDREMASSGRLIYPDSLHVYVYLLIVSYLYIVMCGTGSWSWSRFVSYLQRIISQKIFTP